MNTGFYNVFVKSNKSLKVGKRVLENLFCLQMSSLITK